MSDFNLTSFHPLLYDPAAQGRTRALLQELGATPNRVLGQNFLINSGVLDRIVATSGVQSSDSVLEISPRDTTATLTDASVAPNTRLVISGSSAAPSFPSVA